MQKFFCFTLMMMMMMIASNCLASSDEFILKDRREISQSTVLRNLVTNMKITKNGSAIEILDKAILSSSYGKFQNCDDLIKNFLEDYKKVREFNDSGNVTQESKDKFLKEYCGIDLYNDDIGALTGSDMGYSNIPKTAENIVPENGAYYDLNEYIENKKILELQGVHYENYPAYPSVMVLQNRNLEVYLFNYEKYNRIERSIVNAMYSWWIDSALTLIEQSYGLSFDSSASVKSIKFNVTTLFNPAKIFTEAFILNKDTFASTQKGLLEVAFLSYYLPKTYSLSIDFNKKSLEVLTNPISISNPGGISLTNYKYWDRIFTHEMVHATMAANINNFWKLPTYIKEGLAELVVGGDDTRKSMYYTLLDDINKLNAVYYNNYGDQYTGGCMLLRYFAKQVADSKNIKTNQPMKFSQPIQFGGGVHWNNVGGFSVQNAVSNKVEKNFYRKGKEYGFSKGVAQFGNGANAIYEHYDADKNVETIRIGAADINNTVTIRSSTNDSIYNIASDIDINFYMISGTYLGKSKNYVIFGKRNDGRFVKYIDTNEIRKQYFNDYLAFEWGDIKFQGNTIILSYEKHDGSFRNYTKIGEFQFKWDDKAQWFSVEHIKY